MTPNAKRDAIRALRALQGWAHTTATSKGWHDTPVEFATQLALVHAEVSEVLEAYRVRRFEGWLQDGKPEGVATEMADVIIRLLDTAAHYKIPLVEALIAKMEFNETRTYRHGGKLL